MPPGAKGTRRLLREYGQKLVCVRYRYDEMRRRRLKTVEIVIEEVAWTPPERRLVRIAVNAWETALHARLRKAGGRWTGNGPFWRVRYDRAVKLGLAKRIRPNRPDGTGDQAVAPATKKLPSAETKGLPPAETSSSKPGIRFCR
jgi:hypothetical protein